MKTPTEDLVGVETLMQNHRTIVGMLRKGVEMLHGALKQDKLLRHAVSHDFLEPIGQSMVQELQ